MKVSYVFPQFPVPTQTFAVSDIVTLQSMGHQVTVACLKAAPVDKEELFPKMGVPAGLEVSWANWRDLVPMFRSVVRRLPSMLDLARRIIWQGYHSPKEVAIALACLPRVAQIADELSAAKPDVVHCFWGRHPSMVLASIDASGSSPLRSIFVGAYDLVRADFLVDLGLANADIVFTHSESNGGFFAERHVPAVNVVHRGIPLELQSQDSGERDADHIITASALTIEKNLGAVIDAFERALPARPRLRLTVCGDGPEAGRLHQVVERKGLRSRIAFKGHVPREALFAMMQEASVFLFLSIKPSERLPNVLKEAMLAGCTVVSSRSEGIFELIPSIKHGFVVDAHSPVEIDAALTAALDQTADELQHRQALNKEFIETNMSSSGSMAKYVLAWQGAAGGTIV
jgi:glycosyltransferase involved in cell wall biosynthesis